LLGGRLNEGKKSPKLALMEGSVTSRVQNVILRLVIYFGLQQCFICFLLQNCKWWPLNGGSSHEA